MIRFLLPTACFLAALLALPAGGAELAIEDAEIGFAGVYEAGEWTPLSIRLDGESASDELIVETVTTDADGSAVIRRSTPLTPNSEGSTATLQTVFQSGRLGSDLTVRLLSLDGDNLGERHFRAETSDLPEALPSRAKCWVAAGEFNAPTANTNEISFWPASVVAANLDGHLPTSRLAYSAADLLIVRGDLSPTDEQSETIRQWVVGGGRLAVVLGRHTREFQSGALAGWIPITVSGTVQLRDLSQLEAYSASKRRLPAHARVQAARLSGAAAVLSDSDGPLIARAPLGFGEVTVFAFDLDAPPFSTWAGLPSVVERALLPSEGVGGSRRPRAVPGVTDLATQLIRAEEQFPGLGRTTVGTALLLLLLYAALVGPLDYFLVHRILKRPALTWITLPIFVAFAAWSFDSAARTANGATSWFNEFELLDLDVESGTLRGRTLVTLYSTESTKSDLAIDPTRVASDVSSSAASVPAHLKWLAPPEATFGGTYRDASGGLFRPEYLIPAAPQEAVAKSVPLLVSSSRRFEAQWQYGDAAPLVEARLVSRGRSSLEGTIDHSLPGPIKDFIVVHENSIMIPREAEWFPDEPIDVGSGRFVRRELSSVLTRQVESVIEKQAGEAGADYILTETAYDPQSVDLDFIVQMLTFHDAAGGTKYTGLTNTVFGADDLSTLLKAGRAIVVGRIELPTENVTVASQGGQRFESARRTTFVRLVLPVERSSLPTDLNLAPTETSAAADDPREPIRRRAD